MEGKSERTEEIVLGEIVDRLCKRIGARVEGKVWGNGLKRGTEADDSVAKALRKFKRKKSEDTDLEEYLESRYTWFCDSMMLQNVSKCYMEFNTDASELSVLEDLKPVETSYLDIRKSQRDEWRNMSIKLLTQGIAVLKEGRFKKAASLFRDALKFDPESERARNYHEKALKAAERDNRTSQTKFKRHRDERSDGFSERVGQKRNRSDDTTSSSIDEELRRRISNGDAALLRRMITEERNRKKRKKTKKKKKKKKRRS